MGDSNPDRCDDDFHPKMLPSLPPGDLGRSESADRRDSSDNVRCTPSDCNVIRGGACTAVIGPVLFRCCVEYCEPEPMLETDSLGACAIVWSCAYLACTGILERRDSLYVEEGGFEGAIRESMESVRLCADMG